MTVVDHPCPSCGHPEAVLEPSDLDEPLVFHCAHPDCETVWVGER